MYYGLALFLVPPFNFLLAFVPRGFPTSIKTQRPESTFWAAVTLLSGVLCLFAWAANAYELFGRHDGESLPEVTYREAVDFGHETSTGKALFVYQSYVMRLCIAFFLPLLFAAEIEVTPVLRALPELRFMVTKGPMYLLVGSVMLIAADSWPAYQFVNDTAYIMLIFGALYLGFPAVRVIHELFGDRLSPKTRFYPGLYTFFSVWGVVLGLLTAILFLWEAAVYETSDYGAPHTPPGSSPHYIFFPFVSAFRAPRLPLQGRAPPPPFFFLPPPRGGGGSKDSPPLFLNFKLAHCPRFRGQVHLVQLQSVRRGGGAAGHLR